MQAGIALLKLNVKKRLRDVLDETFNLKLRYTLTNVQYLFTLG